MSNSNTSPTTSFSISLRNTSFLVAGFVGIAVGWQKVKWQGRPSAEMTYDDVSYALEGHRYAEIIQLQGPIALFKNLIASPPHAPLTEMIAMIATLLGGPSTERIYSLNMLVLVFIGWIAIMVSLRLGGIASFAVTGLSSVTPLGYFYFDQFRPDPMYALTVVIFVGALQRAMQIDSPNTRRWASLVGLTASLMLFVKPSFFIFTCFCCFAAMIWATTLCICDRHRYPLLRLLLTRSALSFLFPGIVYLVWLFPDAFRYVYKNMLGENSSAWTGTSPIETIRLSLPTVLIGTRVSLILISLGMVCAIWLYRSGLREYLVIGSASLVVAILSLIPLGATRSPSIFFGLTPSILVLVLTSQLIVAVVQTLWNGYREQILLARRIVFGAQLAHLKVGLIAGALVMLLGFSFKVPYPTPPGLRPPMSVNGRLLDATIRRCQVSKICDSQFTSIGRIPPMLVTFAAEVNPDAVQWEVIHNGYLGQVARLPFLASPTDAITSLANANYVATMGSSPAYVNMQLPVNQLQSQLISYLASSPEWSEVEASFNERVRLFERLFLDK